MSNNNAKKPVDHLDFDVAVQFAEALHGIKNAPQRPGALQATVKDLQEWCCGVPCEIVYLLAQKEKSYSFSPSAIQQAEWLVNTARAEWDEWQGPRALQAIFDQRFRPAIKVFESNPPKPAIECTICSDVGVIAAFTGVHLPTIWKWCCCRHASELREIAPGYLDLCNKRHALQEAARRVPIPTQEEIERLKQQQNANRKESQPV